MCKTPERHPAVITSPPPVKNCKKNIKLDKESEIIPSFLLTGSRFDAAMVASSSDTNQHLSRSSKRSRRTIKPTILKRRSVYCESASQSEERMDLKDILKSLPPPPLGRPPRRVSISSWNQIHHHRRIHFYSHSRSRRTSLRRVRDRSIR